MSSRYVAAVAALLAFSAAPRACSLCPATAQVATLREDAAAARLIVYGTLSNPRLSSVAAGNATDGAATDLAIERVLKNDPILSGRRVLTLPRYVPVDSNRPPQFLTFCDISNGRLDPFRGCPATPAAVEYLVGLLALGPAEPVKVLSYCSRFLDHPDAEVAADAFREFARAGDADIAAAAKRLDPATLRKLLTNPQTPPDRLTLFAYLLGGCGVPADADLLGRMMRTPDDRAERAFGGLLAGYTQLRPDDGWALIGALLSDPRQPFSRRLAALGTVRFFYRSQEAARPRAVQAVAVLLPQGDLADLAIEDLRQWRDWALTAEVLAQFGKKSHSAPMVRRAIVRYALTCPLPETRLFVERLRGTDPGLIRDVEESLQFEHAAAQSR